MIIYFLKGTDIAVSPKPETMKEIEQVVQASGAELEKEWVSAPEGKATLENLKRVGRIFKWKRN